MAAYVIVRLCLKRINVRTVSTVAIPFVSRVTFDLDFVLETIDVVFNHVQPDDAGRNIHGRTGGLRRVKRDGLVMG